MGDQSHHQASLLYSKEQELYQQQLAQQQYAQELVAYKEQLEAFSQQQEAAALMLEQEAETQQQRRMTYQYLEAENPAEIHEQYQYQLQLQQQQMEALQFEKAQLTQVQLGSTEILLQRQQNEHLREKEEYLRQIQEQQALLQEQRGQLVELESQQLRMAEVTQSLEGLKGASADAHTNPVSQNNRGSQLERLQQENKREQTANALALQQADEDIRRRKAALEEQER